MQVQLHAALDWQSLAERVLAGAEVNRAEALAVLRASDAETLAVLAGAHRLRRHHFGDKVHLYRLVNIQSGLCPEDCHYCSQSRVSSAAIDPYPLRDREWILASAKQARDLGASTVCLVASGRGPSDDDVGSICEIVREIKAEPGIHVCVCMGLLGAGQAERFKEAGVDRYNHNLNAAESFYPKMVTTHTYEDRVATVERVKAAGMSPCSGAIFGMGETDEERVEVAFALRDLGSDSIPVNFLHAIPGTPYAGTPRLSPLACLRILAMMRFVNPSKEIRIAGGREVQLGPLQPLALYAANSLFINGYLTTPGQGVDKDRRMIEDLGMKVDSSPPRGG